MCHPVLIFHKRKKMDNFSTNCCRNCPKLRSWACHIGDATPVAVSLYDYGVPLQLHFLQFRLRLDALSAFCPRGQFDPTTLVKSSGLLAPWLHEGGESSPFPQVVDLLYCPPTEIVSLARPLIGSRSPSIAKKSANHPSIRADCSVVLLFHGQQRGPICLIWPTACTARQAKKVTRKIGDTIILQISIINWFKVMKLYLGIILVHS